MANRRLNATITIGGAVSSSLRSAFGATRDEVGRVGQAITQLTARERTLNNTIREQERLGQAGSALRVHYAQQEITAINRQVEALRREQTVLRQIAEAQTAINTARDRSRSAMFNSAGAGFAIGGMLRAPLKAFEDLDAAMNNMQVAMTNSTGKLPMQFDAIKKQTIELGNVLPGTTADFVNLATALKEQGMPMEAIAGGALKSAANLSVVMKMVPEQAGEMVAKLREAFQLGENEFEKMADYTQRARFGFGLKPDDLLLGAKYYGGKLNALGLTGAENVKKIYALQGMAAQQGMDGSTFGTNFSMMLTRVGLMTERLNKNSKEMKAVNAELNKAGIHLEFFDKKGKFAGVDNMVQQLDKIKGLSMEKRLQVLTRLFGEEGGRVADLLARNGTEGYQKAMQAMDAEASLAQRIAIATSSFKNQIEALGGTFTNFLAAVGAPLAEMFAPVLKSLNEIVGGPLQSFIERNQTAVKIVGGFAVAATGVLALGAAISGVVFVTTFAAEGLLMMGTAVMSLGTAYTWLASTALPAVVTAFRAIGVAMMANPVGAAVAGIALAAGLIYTYWGPISSFFTRVWDDLKIAATVGIEAIKNALANWQPMAAFQTAWAGVAQYFAGIWADIKATAAAAIDWVIAKIQSVANLWAATKNFLTGGAAVAPTAGATGAAPATKQAPAPAVAPSKTVGQAAGQPAPVIQMAEYKAANPVVNVASKPVVSAAPAPAVNNVIQFPKQDDKPVKVAMATPTPPPVPAMASKSESKPAPVVNDNRSYNMTVHAAPGQDTKAIADEVMRRQKGNNSKSGALYDRAMGY